MPNAKKILIIKKYRLLITFINILPKNLNILSLHNNVLQEAITELDIKCVKLKICAVFSTVQCTVQHRVG